SDANIVVEAIEPPETLERRFDHRAGLRLVRDVGYKGRGGAAFGGDHRNGALGALAFEIDDEYLCPGARPQDRRGTAAADAIVQCAAAGDDGDLAVETKRIVHRSPAVSVPQALPRCSRQSPNFSWTGRSE